VYEVEHQIVINPQDIAIGRMAVLAYEPSVVGDIASTHVELLRGMFSGAGH
jgi:hypothetical protein